MGEDMVKNSDDTEDFGFYGNEGDEPTKKEVKGITDKVTEFAYTDLVYPCVILNQDFKCPKHQLKVLSNMIKNKCGIKDIGMYFLKGNELFKMGNVSGLQIGFLLDMLGTSAVSGYMDSETRLEGDKLYTLGMIM